MIYMDNASTTMEDYKNNVHYYYNPSSIHEAGGEAKRALRESRNNILSVLNGEGVGRIIFTSGGTESDNLAIKGTALKYIGKGKNIVSTKIEHPAILESLKFCESLGIETRIVGANKDGVINIEELNNSIDEDTVLVSVMYANNETGILQPIYNVGKICKDKKVLFHTDAVQAVGHIKIDVKQNNIDMLSMSGHKFFAPKGVGALYIKNNVKLEPIISGGGQENGFRSGTENVNSIIKMQLALTNEDYNNYHTKYVEGLRNKFAEKLLTIDGATLNTDMENSVSGTLNIRFDGVNAESLVLYMSSKGLCASAGSACSSGNLKPSHVLTAMGLSPSEAHNSVRFSLSRNNTIEEVEEAYIIVKECVNDIRKVMGITRE